MKIKDVLNDTVVKRRSLYHAAQWFVEKGIASTFDGAYQSVRDSLSEKKVVYKRYIITRI